MLATFVLASVSDVLIVRAANSEDTSGFGGQVPSVSPKFGDRISPRHRPFVEGINGLASNSLRANGVRAANSEPSASVVYTTSNGSPTSSVNNSLSHHSNSAKGSSAPRSAVSAPAVEPMQIEVVEINQLHHQQQQQHQLVDEYDGVPATTIHERRIGDRRASRSKKESDRSVVGHTYDGDTVTAHPLNADNSDDVAVSTMDKTVASAISVLGSAINGNVSAQAHRLEMSTEFFVVPSTAASPITRATTIRPGGVVLAARPQATTVPASFGNRIGVTPPTIVSTHGGHPSGLRKEPWVVPVLVLASLSMIMMAAFEIFVLCKAWRTSPSRRHLFLGQMLLLGLFACAGLAAVITATPTLLSCATVRFGAGVAYALVFASLLVKCVFLISLNGGVYLPAPYQGLLLLFAVLIQVAVGAQWLLTSPPAVDNVSVASRNSATLQGRYPLLLTAQDITTTVALCKTPFTELLFSLVYVVFLILFVAILAIKSRGIRDNYREATYIGLAIGGSIPIWLAWTLCGLAVTDRHKDACLAFGLVATSATVFLVMFMPKGRQLAAMGKEGLYVEDREEQFSSLSRAGSGYSPSFFHFKPIKYGVMGPAPTSTNNTGMGGTASKHQAVATLGGGKCFGFFFCKPFSLSLSLILWRWCFVINFGIAVTDYIPSLIFLKYAIKSFNTGFLLKS